MQRNELRFLANECIWQSVVIALRQAGFVCKWIQDFSPGVTDREVLDLSVSENLLLVTEDSDFGNLIFHERLDAFGVVRVRLSEFDGAKKEIAANVASRIAEIGDCLIGQFTTIEPARTRQRALPARLDEKD